MFHVNGTISTNLAQAIEEDAREIARLAYQFYEKRGHAAGHALDDWLNAEVQVKQHNSFHSPHRLSWKIAGSLIVLGVVAWNAILVGRLLHSQKTPKPQRSSFADQLALTAGYRAILHNPAYSR